MSDYRIWGVNDGKMGMAIRCIQSFVNEYPARVGSHNGVIYSNITGYTVHVYRTKSGQITARGNST